MLDRITALLRRVLQTKDPNMTFSQIPGNKFVYKIVNGKDILFLRMAHEKGEMVSTQILAHEQLAKKGARIPRFVSWDDANATLGSSYMIVKQFPGLSLQRLKDTNKPEYDLCVDNVLSEAAEDIARATMVSTKDYGHIKRTVKKARELVGEFDLYKSFLLDKFEKKVKDLQNAGFEIFTENELDRYKMLVYKYISEGRPGLAHGNFNMDQIFVSNGRYAGIIDWGDIKSTESAYDIAYFTAFHPENEESILKGFTRVARVGKDFEAKLILTRIAICVDRLAEIARNGGEWFENHPLREVLVKDVEKIKSL